MVDPYATDWRIACGPLLIEFKYILLHSYVMLLCYDLLVAGVVINAQLIGHPALLIPSDAAF